MTCPINTAETLTIEKLVHGGPGLARTSSGVVLIGGVIPGEKVIAVPAGKQGGMQYMELVDIIEPSPFRRKPPCQYFGVCGGCDWLFINYDQQPAFKNAIFTEAMHRIGKIAEFSVPDLVASPELFYRRRAQIKIDAAKTAGFFRGKSIDVVKIDNCPLCCDGINRLLKIFSDNPAAIPDGLRNCKVIDGEGALASEPVLNGITNQSTSIRCGTITFDVCGGDFVQSNRFLLEKLALWVSQQCAGETMIDLYGGAGFFSMVLARNFKKGWLIESDRVMVEQAKRNFLKNGISHFRAVAAPAEQFERFVPRHPDVLIVDPPRPGLTKEVREATVRCNPDTIVYVSCNCATQARDAAFFLKNGAYRITSAALFDLYPNTHHTETVLVFKKQC